MAAAPGSSEDGLIQAPELATGTASRAASALCLATFLLATCATGLVDALWPRPLPQLIGAERADDEHMRRRANLWDGSWTRLLEHDLELRSRVRATLGGYYTLALYRWLDETDPRTLAGDGDWLFLAHRAVPPPQSDEEIAGATAAVLGAAARRLASLGVRLVVAPIPRKAVVHAEHLPSGVDPRPGVERALLAALQRVGVEAADLGAAFGGAGDVELYYRADGHWTEAAQAVAAEEIARTAGILADPASRTTTLGASGPMPQDRNTLYFLGVGPDHPAIDTIVLPDGVAWDVFDSAGSIVDDSGPSEMTRWALTGTSFTARRKLGTFLSHFAQEPIWNGAFEGALLLDNVRALLREHADRLPELLVVEFPVHHAFMYRELAGVVRWPRDGGELFAAYPPPAVSVLVPDEELPRRGRAARRGELLSLTGGRIAHSGEGVAALRLRGTVVGEPVELDATHAGGRQRFTWHPGQSEVVLPLLATEPVAAPYSLFAVDEGFRRITLTGAELVVELDVEAAVAASEVHAVTADGDRWLQRVTFPPDARVPTLAALLLELDANRALGKAIDVRLRSSAGPPVPFHLEQVAARATLVLGMGGLAGAEGLVVDVRGTGPAPARLVRSAALAAPLGTR